MRRRTLPLPQITKKRLLILVVIVLVLVPIGVAGYHQLQWQQYVNNNADTYTRARETAQSIITIEELSARTLTDARQTLDEQLAMMCAREPLLLSVRMRVSDAAGTERARCVERKAEISEVRAQLATIVGYLETDQLVAQALEKAKLSLSEAKDTDYEARRQAWRVLANKLDDVDPVDSHRPSLETERKAVRGVIAGYDLLIEANSSESRPKYDKAISAVQAAYKTTQDTAKASSKEYDSLVDSVIESIKKL